MISMKKKLNRTIICNSKKHITTEDVDNFMYNDILGSKNVEKIYDSDDGFNVIDNGYGLSESYPIKIEILKNIISELEKDGCNYLTVDYNCDHPDYTFYGIEVHAASDVENIEIEEKETQKKLKEISDRLALLDKEREKLRMTADDLINIQIK